MKAYVMTTGALFGVATAVHIWRLLTERGVATDPHFLVLTVVGAALAVWAWRVTPRNRAP